MHIVDRIFKELGGQTAIATATGDPVQTVDSWKAKGNIPHWRRQAVIDAAKRLDKPLPADALEYLASADPAPKRAIPEPDHPETQAAAA